MNVNETLNKQGEPNPIMDVLIGMTVRYEGLTDIIRGVIEDAGEGEVPELAKFLQSCDKYIEDMERAKFFKTYICKMQAPISSSEDNPGHLLYNEDRSLMTTVILEDPNLASWYEGDLKMYVEVRLWTNGTLSFIRRVEEQPW